MNEYDINILYILLIEQLKQNSVQELRTREGGYMKLIKPSLNKYIAGRSVREYQIDSYEAPKETIIGHTDKSIIMHRTRIGRVIMQIINKNKIL